MPIQETEHVRRLIARHSMLRTRRSQHENVWQEIADISQPYRGDITTRRSPGNKRIGPVFDTTMTQSADTLTNFLISQLFPPDQPWLQFDPPRGFESDLDVRVLLDESATDVLGAYSDSNLYTEAAMMMRDFLLPGNTALTIEEAPPVIRNPGNTFGGLIFEAVPLARVWFQTGRGGKVNFLVREICMPAMDAWLEWPGSTSIAKIMEAHGTMQEVSILHFVYPNENSVPRGTKDLLTPGTQKPFVSEWIVNESGLDPELLRTRGFDYFPYVVGRYMVVDNEEYGRGLGHISRSDAKGANEIKRQELIAITRDLNPALILEHDGHLDIDVGPNGIAYIRPNTRAPEYLRSGSDYASAEEIRREDQRVIRSNFLGDALQEPESQPRSAAETRARQARALQRLAAPAQRVLSELLVPIVTTTVGIMRDAGALPQLDALAELTGGSDIGLSMVSPFFTAQKAQTAQKVFDLLQRRLALFQATQDPVWLDDLDIDEITQLEAELTDIPKRVFRSLEEREQLRAQRQEQQAVAAEQQQQIVDAQTQPDTGQQPLPTTA